jgi:hypothetical protein
MSTHYLFPFRKGLRIFTPNFLLPGSFCNLSISFGVAINGLCKIRKKLLCPFMGKVFRMLKRNLPPLFRVIDQETGPEEIF